MWEDCRTKNDVIMTVQQLPIWALDLRHVVTKDTMSAMVKLAREIKKSVSDVVGIASWRIRECMLVSTANSAE